jgi:nucleoside-diphosphate-sugar epimerase
MNILFIGGTGNISADCAALLHRRGHQISVLTRGRTPIPTGYRSIQADRKDAAAMRGALADFRPDVVLDFIGYDIPDVQADHDIFEGSIRQYIFISSTTVYLRPAQKLPFTEDAPQGNPWWDYAQKKIACEQWLQERLRHDGFPVTIVRPSHTYSHLWIPNPISSASYSFAARLENGKPVFVPDDGETRWTLTAASDFAVGLAGLVGNERAVGEAFHITSDEVLTWNQIYAEIAIALGVNDPQVVKVPTEFICQHVPQLIGNLKGDKSHPGVFDNSKIKRFVPEFNCLKPFRAGIRESVEWLRTHPDKRVFNPQVDTMIETVLQAWEKQ